MTDVTTVTIKLTGSEYRALVRELEYHQLTLNREAQDISGGEPRRTALKRAGTLEDLRNRIAR